MVVGSRRTRGGLMRWVHQLVKSEDQWIRRRRHFQGCHEGCAWLQVSHYGPFGTQSF